jgi:hypothetical protein
MKKVMLFLGCFLALSCSKSLVVNSQESGNSNSSVEIVVTPKVRPEPIDISKGFPFSGRKPGPVDYFYNEKEKALELALQYLKTEYADKEGQSLDYLFPGLEEWLDIDVPLGRALIPEDITSRSRTDTRKKMTLIQAKELVIRHLGKDANEHWPIVLSLLIEQNPDIKPDLEYLTGGTGLFALSIPSNELLSDYQGSKTKYKNPVFNTQEAIRRYFECYKRYDDDKYYYWLVLLAFIEGHTMVALRAYMSEHISKGWMVRTRAKFLQLYLEPWWR